MTLLRKKPKTINSLTLFAIIAFGLHLFVILVLIIQGITIRQLALRKPPNFVQLIDGKKIILEGDKDRDPQLIREFITKTMELMFNWSGTLPPQTLEEVNQPKTDPGISITTPQGNNAKIMTSSWIASFALSEDFRQGFLSKIAEITPPEVFSKNPQQKITTQLKIKRIEPPELIEPGQWRVGMVADLIQQKKADGRKIVIPFNKDILVRSIDYFSYPLTDQMTAIQKAIYGVRQQKLEIYEIRNLCLLDSHSFQKC